MNLRLARYSLYLFTKAVSTEPLIVFILLLWISGTLTGARFFCLASGAVGPRVIPKRIEDTRTMMAGAA
jgi:hypothetical protein